MKTVILTSDKIAIPVKVQFYITASRMVTAITELLIREIIFEDSKKREIILEIKNLYKLQGYSIESDWQEDNVYYNESFNAAYPKAIEIAKKLFPELGAQEYLKMEEELDKDPNYINRVYQKSYS